MRIVFGWNHFKIRSYSLPDLGIFDVTEKNSSVELRQRYFHFFWIPFFGIGKTWAVRRNGKLYELPEALKTHIRQRQLSEKTPWYTFAGPLLIVAGFDIYGFSEKVNDIRSEMRAKKDYEAKAMVLTDLVNKTDSHDYFRLEGQGVSGSNVLLKVNEVKGNDITFSMLSTGLSEYELSPMKMQYLFAMKGDGTEKITVGKQKMQHAIPLKYEDAGKGADILGDGHLYVIQEIYHLDGPLLTDRRTGMMGSRQLSIDLMNMGWPGTITKITNLSGGFKWTNPLPRQLASANNDYDYNGQFHLNGVNETADPKYKVEITMVDTLQKEHKYIVEGEGFTKTVTQEY